MFDNDFEIIKIIFINVSYWISFDISYIMNGMQLILSN